MKILFISHDASLTGGSVLLLNLIKLLNEPGIYESTVLFRKGGPMEPDFAKVARTFLWDQPVVPETTKRKKIIRRLRNRHIGNDEHNSEILEEVRKADVIINNTITNGELLETILKDFNGKVFSYIHELEMASVRFATPRGIKLTLDLSDKLIVPSEAVKHHLHSKYAIDVKKIVPLSYYIHNKGTGKNEVPHKKQNELIVGGCGTLDWRKGIDIFIGVARRLLSADLLQHFVFRWKGANINSSEYAQCLYDIEKAGLSNSITLMSADTEMDSFYNNIDIFFLSSREDPYPLVVLEAASFGKPTVCFSNAGGAPEFVQEDAGSVVPYLDISAVVAILLEYKSNPEMVLEKGQKAKCRVQEMHQTQSAILQQFDQIVNN
ncbi:glycosyltransferase family 4 protein [Ginsengibacter hankyongi]|uniref:Glycosyltransferase family 4 protein n=1 Tax=Ginsengibacter hankyongi TaxID=2607284 RepID=A0A5J5IBR2_9BACT|nr:glycosyltransferase family 4 protein [Ginsengibacter hankyongi]KAA9036387.1 glycosyltransferase family 4 protein [Ginsengibacter hankyongi]